MALNLPISLKSPPSAGAGSRAAGVGEEQEMRKELELLTKPRKGEGSFLVKGLPGSTSGLSKKGFQINAVPFHEAILWNGHDVTSPGVFQQYKLQLNWMSLKDAVKEKLTVLENVQWFELLEGKHGRSAPAIELMGLGRLMNDKARMLSMGQRKRLQLARLLAIDRPIWLLDEPSVALDSEGVKLLEYIIAEHRKKGGIVIVATHLPIEIEDSMNLRLPQRELYELEHSADQMRLQ
ncbi:ABC transporter I family member 1 [Triticum urartu]|uniref:ABC transporter I family member 1 n=1 Tax=Triticum urartu TaxID=4572 RepID=M8A651_TRIUA|nr:ABC transporter I family member 1 [Triticum urartu]